MSLQTGNMSQVAGVVKDIIPLASNIVGETASTIRHRRENPTPKPTNSSDANISNYGLFNYVDSRNMTDGNERSKISSANTMTPGVLLGVGIGAGIAGAMWAINKVSQSKQRHGAAMPARGQGRIVKEEVEEEEQGKDEEEEEEYEEEEEEA